VVRLRFPELPATPRPPQRGRDRSPLHECATLGTIVTRFPGLGASVVPAQVSRLLATVLPVGDGAIATERQLDELLGSIVERVVAGSGRLRGDPPTELDELVDAMVLLLARNSVAQETRHGASPS